MAKCITVLNNKGGTAKTTTVLNLAAALRKRKFKVLVVDFDGQCNLSNAAGIAPGTEPHIGNVILRKASALQAVKPHEAFDVLPASSDLPDFEFRLNSEPGREYTVKEQLLPLHEKYDYILFDCPPNLGLLSINALVASDYYLVPMQAENFAFIGLDKILHTAELVQKRLNPNLKPAGILLVKFDKRTKFGQAIISNLKAHEQLGSYLFKTVIRQDIALMESWAFNQSIFEYGAGSRGAADYKAFAREFVKRCTD